MITNLNFPTEFNDKVVIDAYQKVITFNYTFLKRDFITLNEHFFEIDNQGIINVKKETILSLNGYGVFTNEALPSTVFIVTKNNNEILRRNFIRQSAMIFNFNTNSIPLSPNDKLTFSCLNASSNNPVYWKFYLKN